MRRKLLITGCGRSGTNYSAMVFRRAGADVQHEMVGAEGCSSWYFAPVSSDMMPPPYLKHKGGKNRHADRIWRQDVQFDLRVHQVRHPLLVIRSVTQSFSKDDWRFIARHTGQSFAVRNPLLRSMQYWLRWNLLAGRNTDCRIRVEDFEKEWPWLSEAAGVPGAPMPDVSKRVNAHTGYRIPKQYSPGDMEALDPILFSRIERMAEEYGYTNPWKV